MPSGFAVHDKASRYQPLFDLLAAATGDEIVLTYRECAALIGGPLPETAILGTSWWTNKTYTHVLRWKAMGWRAHAERDHLRVRFTRDAAQG